MLDIYASIVNEPWFIIVIIIAFFGLVALITWLIYHFVIMRNKSKENPQTPEEVAQEELDNVLVDYNPDSEKKTNTEDDD